MLCCRYSAVNNRGKGCKCRYNNRGKVANVGIANAGIPPLETGGGSCKCWYSAVNNSRKVANDGIPKKVANAGIPPLVTGEKFKMKLFRRLQQWNSCKITSVYQMQVYRRRKQR